MKSLTLFTFLCLLFQNSLSSQDKHSTFLELGGPGFGISVNTWQNLGFDKKGQQYFLRAGLGIIGPIPNKENGGEALLTLPFGAGIRIGKHQRFETAAGLTLFYLTYTGFEGPAAFVSFGYHITPNIRIVLSPFIGSQKKLNYYFGTTGPVLFFGGFDFTLARKTSM